MSSGFPTRSDTTRAVQPLKMARGLKFRNKEEEGLLREQRRLSAARSAPLFPQMQNGFLIRRRIWYDVRVLFVYLQNKCAAQLHGRTGYTAHSFFSLHYRAG